MDAIGEFLKVALYRVIFVLIVGIPAVEVFSFTFFGNGIVIQKVDNDNKTVPAKVKINLQDPKLDWYHVNIPGRFYFNEPKSANFSIEIPNAEVRVSDPQVEITNSEIYKIGNFLFRINQLPTVGWIFYLIIAWILGEILCFLGETFIGRIFFGYKPYDFNREYGGVVEKIVPFINVNLTVLDFVKASSNSTMMEISEIHFVLSRIFSGLFIFVFILSFSLFGTIIFNKKGAIIGVILGIFIIIGGIIIGIIGGILCFFIIIIIIETITGTNFRSIIETINRAIIQYKIEVIFIIVGIIMSLLLALFYRAHANRLLKAVSNSTNNERNGEES